jgi:putative DNA primase/helicase
MSAADIAAALGGAHRSGAWWRCRCPVHGSRGATLALRDGDRGLIAVCHAVCSRADILAELRRRGLIGGIAEDRPVSSPSTRDDDAARRMASAHRIWDRARDARGTPVERYLRARSITIAVPCVLRWAPSLQRPDGTCGPAMVARIDGVDGELIGVHRTWLDRDATGRWRRRDRAMLGRAASGAVRLAPAAETLMVAEGIETAMAAMTATAMPAWAALSTSGLVALRLPPIVRTVIILADNDVSGAGERAARAAAARWLGEGRRVRIALPPEPGTDMADVLAGRGHARITELRDVAA